jgi:hypothetical protein
MATEVLCARWIMILVRELVAGTTQSNDLPRVDLDHLLWFSQELTCAEIRADLAEPVRALRPSAPTTALSQSAASYL